MHMDGILKTSVLLFLQKNGVAILLENVLILFLVFSSSDQYFLHSKVSNSRNFNPTSRKGGFRRSRGRSSQKFFMDKSLYLLKDARNSTVFIVA